MDEKIIFRSAFWWIFFFVLLVLIILLSARQLGMQEEEHEEHIRESVLKKEVILPDVEDRSEVIKEISGGMIKTEVQSEESEISKAREKPFTIQVASFRERVRAELVAKKLKKASFSSTTSAKDLGEKGIWYRVRVGDFNTEDEARELLKTLKGNYKDSFIKLK